jgi:hypothetical protein
MILAVFFTLTAHAQEPAKEKSAFEQALEQNQMAETKERWVEFNGTRYREILYQGKHFYLLFNQKDSDSAQVDCDLSSNGASPQLVEAGGALYKRTRLFVQLLRETCEETGGGRRKRVLSLDPRLGFTIPDGPKSMIKNKKVYLGPMGPGFYGEW